MEMACVAWLAFISVFCVSNNEAKRVLMIPIPFTSHTKYHANIARELIDLGHEVWVCMSPYVMEKNVLDTRRFQVLRYTSNHLNVEELTMNVTRDAFWNNETEDLMKIADLNLDHQDKMLRDPKFLQDVKKINPDLFVIDNIPYAYMMAVLAYKFDKPFAYVGPAYLPIYHRVPFSFAALPAVTLPLAPPMDFWGRVVSTHLHLVCLFLELFQYTDAVSRYAPERPYMPIRELLTKAEITLVDSEHIVDFPQPLLPNVLRIGGTSISPVKQLKEPFKSFVESSEDGVIVASFGSYVINIPVYVRMKMINAFSRLKFKVIWRVNMTSPNPEKIMTSQWLPQNDLLAHPKVKLFVSHCGNNGQYEAMYHAVPLLCLPMFGDQNYNAERTRVKGWSLTSNIKTMTSDDLVTLITELHENTSYKANIQKASEIFKIVQGLPVEKAAFWLDHVIKYGGAYIRYSGQEMPSYQFYCLDLLAFFMFIICIVISVLYFIISRLVRLYVSYISSKKQKTT